MFGCRTTIFATSRARCRTSASALASDSFQRCSISIAHVLCGCRRPDGCNQTLYIRAQQLSASVPAAVNTVIAGASPDVNTLSCSLPALLQCTVDACGSGTNVTAALASGSVVRCAGFPRSVCATRVGVAQRLLSLRCCAQSGAGSVQFLFSPSAAITSDDHCDSEVDDLVVFAALEEVRVGQCSLTVVIGAYRPQRRVLSGAHCVSVTISMPRLPPSVPAVIRRALRCL